VFGSDDEPFAGKAAELKPNQGQNVQFVSCRSRLGGWNLGDLRAGERPADDDPKEDRRGLGGVDTYRIHKTMAARVTTAR
jgi:hypothetical protein